MGALRRYSCTVLDRLPHLLLRLEGLVIVAAAVVLYFHEDFGWILFVALIPAPDFSFADLPVALGAVGVIGDSSGATKIWLIWPAQIGADRLLGYGLKYPTAFKDTHLSRV